MAKTLQFLGLGLLLILGLGCESRDELTRRNEEQVLKKDLELLNSYEAESGRTDPVIPPRAVGTPGR